MEWSLHRSKIWSKEEKNSPAIYSFITKENMINMRYGLIIEESYSSQHIKMVDRGCWYRVQKGCCVRNKDYLLNNSVEFNKKLGSTRNLSKFEELGATQTTQQISYLNHATQHRRVISVQTSELGESSNNQQSRQRYSGVAEKKNRTRGGNWSATIRKKRNWDYQLAWRYSTKEY